MKQIKVKFCVRAAMAANSRKWADHKNMLIILWQVVKNAALVPSFNSTKSIVFTQLRGTQKCFLWAKEGDQEVVLTDKHTQTWQQAWSDQLK